jgi:hypothetical protein
MTDPKDFKHLSLTALQAYCAEIGDPTLLEARYDAIRKAAEASQSVSDAAINAVNTYDYRSY